MNFKVVLGILIVVAFFALGGLRIISKGLTTGKNFINDSKAVLSIEEKRQQVVSRSAS